MGEAVSNSPDYRKRPVLLDSIGPWLIVAGGVLVLGFYGILQLGWKLSTGSFVPGHPITVISGLVRGEQEWPWQTSALLVVFMLLLTVLAAVITSKRGAAKRKSDTHKKARHLGDGSQMSKAKADAKVAAGKLAAAHVVTGLMIAKTLNKGSELWCSWRDGMVAVMGPGAGKTTGLAIPLIYEAPGLVIATSNKRDIADAIRLVREALGTFWCFDPQRIADYEPGGVPSWWWNPLSYVTDETRASSLAKLFATNDRKDNDKSDPFFDKQGPKLLARLMFAAALDKRFLPDVFIWLSSPNDKTPVKILEKHGYAMSAVALNDTYNYPVEQKGGVFATAQTAVEFLDNQDALAWISPLSPADQRPQFFPEVFIRAMEDGRKDTLMSLSKEGDGSFGPITAALTKAVLDAAEEYAQRECGGKLPIPLVGMFDEAANCCPIPDLPKKYSFYGSYSIFLVTILQNWAQGVTAWGKTGMEQLWAAATHRLVGGGAEDMDFLKHVSDRLGNHDVKRYSDSRSSGRNSSFTVSSSISQEPIMAPSDLAKMEFPTVVVLPSGGDGVVATAVRYWERGEEMNESIETSINQFRPKAKVLS